MVSLSLNFIPRNATWKCYIVACVLIDLFSSKLLSHSLTLSLTFFLSLSLRLRYSSLNATLRIVFILKYAKSRYIPRSTSLEIVSIVSRGISQRKFDQPAVSLCEYIGKTLFSAGCEGRSVGSRWFTEQRILFGAEARCVTRCRA